MTHGASKWQIAEMFTAMREVWDDVVRSRLVDDELRRLVRTDSITGLWEAGVHPDQVEAHARLARDAGVPDALPELYFLGMAYGDRDPEWVAQSLPHCPTGDNATKLAWWPTDAAPALLGDVGRWLGLGVAAHQIPPLTSVGSQPEDSELIAGSVGLSRSSSARLMARWAALGVRLSARHAQSLDAAGQLHAGLPGRAAVDRLLERIRAHDEPTGQHSEADWSDAAVLLAVHGTVASAAWAIRRGQHIDLQTERSDVGRTGGDRNEV